MGTRWSPLAVLLGVAALVLAAVGVVAVIADDGDNDRPVTQSATGADQVSTTSTTLLETTTTTTAVPATTTTIRGTTTTVRRTTTTRVPTTTTTRPAAATTTVAGRPLCAAEQVDIGVALGTSYAPGEPVRMTTTLHNKSSTPCFYRGYTVTMTFLDPGGRTLVAQAVHADDVEDRAFAPGQSITHDATWDPKVCQTPPCSEPPDRYSVSAAWSFSGGQYGATQEFIVRST